MLNKIKFLLICLTCVFAQAVFAQSNPNYPNNPNYPIQQRVNLRDTGKATKQITDDQLLDSLRKKQDHKRDTIIFSAKFIRITNEKLLRDSTQLKQLDTTLTNFEVYSPIFDIKTPKITLGYTGTPARDLLFNPSKTIGFDVGLHALDPYLLNPEDVNYYRARVPFTSLYFISGGISEQMFKATHAQNINPQLNIGFNLDFAGPKGFYSSNSVLQQNVNYTNIGAFAWYESKNKRYNLLANILYNNLKAPETGSIQKDSIFKVGSIDKTSEPVRLAHTYENWTNSGLYLKQFYYIGHLDSTKKGSASVLPTQRVAYTINYNTHSYNFIQNDQDNYHVFPDYYYEYNYGRDSLTVTHLQNDFSYSFYLRSKAVSIIKNEVKLDLGLTHDYYNYAQYVNDTTLNQYGTKITQQQKVQAASFQNITLKARFSYKFSNKIGLEGDFQQIAQGRNAGDYLYDAKVALAGNEKAGKIIFEGYAQNNTPALVYSNWISNHYIFHTNLKNQKTNSLSFNYLNPILKLDFKAEYFLINNYLYFSAQPNGNDASPTQVSAPINLLKLSISKSFTWRQWQFDDFLVYQKSDYQNTLRTPQFYNFSSLYYKVLLFKVLHSNIGMDVRYNSTYIAPSYAVGLGQFYNGTNVTFSSYPIASVFFRATLQRTNFFIMYDYVNQGLFSPGFYTVNRYPQMDRLLKFGVSWTFYN